MKLGRQVNSSISHRILLLALLPLAAVAMILASYFIVTRHTDLQLSLQQQARSQAAYLASASTVAVFAGDLQTLAQISTAALRDPLVKSLVFYDREGHILYADGIDPPLVDADFPEGDGQLADGFRVPVYFPSTAIDDVIGTSLPAETEKILGWLQLGINDEQLINRQRQLLLTGLSITLLGVLVVGLIALRMARGLILPIQELVRTLQLLEAGERKVRAQVTGSDELGRLGQAVNALAARVEESEVDLQSRIDRATVRLTNTLSVLARRNSELELTRVELEDALLARDNFLARISHELRTPLTSMLGYSDLLGRSELDEVQRGFNSNVRFAAQLLLGTINDLLDLASLGANAVHLQRHDFDLPRCLEQVCLIHAPAAWSKGIELILAVERDVPARVYADELRICQIINNLVGNAVKFTERGRVVLSVSCGARLAGQVELKISVEDTGIGINATQLERIFDAFTRAEGVAAERYEGTGLGLAIVRSLAQLMDGSVVAESEPGRGTVVSCRLLLDAGTDTLSSQLEAFPQCAVLISEPDPVCRRSLRAMSLAATRDVTVFPGVEPLLEQLRQGWHADVLLLGVASADCHLPGINAMLAAIAGCYRGSVVLVSPQLPANCEVPAGLYLIHLLKPVGHRRLNSVLRELFGSRLAGNDMPPGSEIVVPPSKPPFAGVRILLAEDNVLNRDMISQILRNMGAYVSPAVDGDALLASYQANQFDLLLVDLNMPGVNGRDAVVQLQNMHGSAALPPVVLLTAAVMDEAARQEYDGLVAAVLSKPLDLSLFTETLGRILQLDAPAVATSFIEIQPVAMEQELHRLATAIAENLQQSNYGQLQQLLHQICGLPLLGKNISGWQLELVYLAGEFEARQAIDDQPELTQRLRSVLEKMA